MRKFWGFSFSADGKYFYNIEKPVTSTATQFSIYDTSDFKKVNTLFADNVAMVLEYLNAYKDWELSGFTQKSLEWNSTLNTLEKIPSISIKEVHDKS